ncbi:MAG TPA: alpha/beta hydrolase [Geminocystis sp. M7585_C2015_104]|nr:alpha/beta hydrolase [Geminocystis sp. M7585_C2015_104]
MLSPQIQQRAKQLQESTSRETFNQIRFIPLKTSICQSPIVTSYIHQGKTKRNRPLLLLHGFDSSLLEFRRLIPKLSNHCQVWALDLLGFGFTQRLPNLNYSPATIKAHVYHFWAEVIKQPMVLIGASMGGATAIDFCLSHPHIVEKLILIDSVGLTKPPLVSRIATFLPFGYLATEFLRNSLVRQKISEKAYYNPSLANEDARCCASLHTLCDNWSQALISFTRSGGYGDFSAQLGKILCSTLILWGRQDKILGTNPATRFQQLLPHSKLIWIEECGHVPHLEKPDTVSNHILEFLRD